MKNTDKKSAIAFLCACLLAGIIAGCSTTSTNPVASLLTPQNLTLAADIGTVAELQKQPADAIYFKTAEDLLNTYATGTNDITYADTEAALAASGQTNALASTVITALLPQIESYAQQAAGTNGTTEAEFKTGAGAVATGIGEGLTATGH